MRKARRVAPSEPDRAAALPLPDRITDLLIDIDSSRRCDKVLRLRQLDAMCAEAHERVKAGTLTTQRRSSRIWATPKPRPAPTAENEYPTNGAMRRLLRVSHSSFLSKSF